MVRDLSLKTRMALAVSLLFVVFSAIVAYFSISYFENKTKKILADQQFLLACTIAQDIDDKILMLQNALLAASKKVPPDITTDPVNAKRFVDERITLHALFDTTVFILDRKGTIVAESPALPERRVFNLAFREYFQKTVATGKPVISIPYLSSLPDHRPVIMLTAPVFDSKGRIACILCGGMRLLGTNLLSDLQQTKVGANGYIILSTSDNIMIMHPDRSRILKTTAPPGANKLFDKALQGFDGSGETVNSLGTPMLSSFKHLTATNWIAGVNFPISEAYAPMYRTRQYLVGGIAAGTFAMLVIAWLVMKRLTAPLQEFTRHVAALPGKEGEQKRVPIVSKDEIGTLARAFNDMVTALDAQQEALRESENNFRTLAETACDGMLVIVGTGTYAYANQRIADLTGYSIQELCQLGICDLAHPDDFAYIIGRFNTIISRKEFTRQHETRMIRKDGLEVPVEISSALTLWRGEPAVLIIVRDISERRRVDKALRNSYTLLQKTFASLNEAVFIVETGTRIIRDCNITVEKMFGYTMEELIGVTTSCLHLSEENSSWFGSAMLQSYEDKGYFETTFQMKRKDGTVFDSEHCVTPIRDDDGLITSHVCVVRDVSERKHAEERLRKSEKHLAEAQKAAHVGSWEVDVASGKITWSQEMFNVTGRDPRLSEPTYEELMQIIHPDDRQALADCMKAASSEGRPYQLDSRRIASDGSIRHLFALGKPIFDDSGKVVRLFGTVIDITERKQAEERLLESEARFRAIFEGARDAVIIADIETGILLDANVQAEVLLGRPKSAIIGMHQTELHPADMIDLARKSFEEHIRTNGAYPLCQEVMTADNERVSVEINASLIQLNDGRHVMLGIFRNITERRRAEEEIKYLNVNLQRRATDLAVANRDLEAFGYSLSHDLKGPLTAIYSAAQTLEAVCAEQMDENGRFCIDSICKASERMEELLDAMLLLARISRSDLQLEEIDLSELAVEILARLQEQEPTRVVEYVITPEVKVLADARLMKSALENLLGNAWKYTRKSAVAHIEFGMKSLHGEKTYFVRDNGIGFEMKNAEIIFLPFNRLYQAKEFEGTGIGLTTVQRIIQRHGGKLWGEGEPDQGATFYFTLTDN